MAYGLALLALVGLIVAIREIRAMPTPDARREAVGTAGPRRCRPSTCTKGPHYVTDGVSAHFVCDECRIDGNRWGLWCGDVEGGAA